MKFLENNRNAFIPLYPALERMKGVGVSSRLRVDLHTRSASRAAEGFLFRKRRGSRFATSRTRRKRRLQNVKATLVDWNDAAIERKLGGIENKNVARCSFIFFPFRPRTFYYSTPLISSYLASFPVLRVSLSLSLSFLATSRRRDEDARCISSSSNSERGSYNFMKGSTQRSASLLVFQICSHPCTISL